MQDSLRIVLLSIFAIMRAVPYIGVDHDHEIQYSCLSLQDFLMVMRALRDLWVCVPEDELRYPYLGYLTLTLLQ